MLVLFDSGTPRGLARFLAGHTVREARSEGWDTLRNGELLEAAEAAGFDVLLTPDKNIRHQQNLAGRRIAIVVLGNAQWPVLRRQAWRIVEALDKVAPGSYFEVDIPTGGSLP